MKPRAVVVLPSTSYRAADFVQAAASLGVDLVVASEQPPPFDMGDGYVQLDCSDPYEAAREVASLGDEVALDGIVAADDVGVLIASVAGTSLGLPANPPDAARSTRDKLELRRRLGVAEVPQPRYAEIGPDTDLESIVTEVGLPLVVKPLERSASQGVIRADDLAGLKEGVAEVRRILADPTATLLAEEYMAGEEVAVEGLLTDGQLTVLAILDKPDTRTGPYFPETILVTPSRLPESAQDECARVAQTAVHGLGLAQGPVHIELKVEGNRARVIEVAARSIGGLCSRSLNFGLMGTTLETLILRNALGMDKPELQREATASGVLMIPIPGSGVLESVEGEAETRAIPGITGIDLTIRPGSDVLAPPEGDAYVGFVFAREKTAEAVERALRMANETMEIVIR
jgi:biotin carboxylase